MKCFKLMRYTIKFIPFLLFFLTYQVVHGQSIQGKIVDHENKPIPFSTIYIVELTRGSTANIEGNLLPYIGNGYTPFVLELRDALHAKGKGITCALGAVRFHEAVTQESLEAYDFINVMVYDKTGVWRPNNIGPHSPYSY